MPDLVHTTFTLLIIPVAAIAIPALLTWARDLNSAARRVRRLEEQNSVVTFWENWIKTEELLRPTGTKLGGKREKTMAYLAYQARRELHRAGWDVIWIYRRWEYKLLDRYPLSHSQFQKYKSSLSWYRRAFFLYKAPNPQARMMKVSAAIGVGMGCLSVILFSKALTQQKIILQLKQYSGGHSIGISIAAMVYIPIVLYAFRKTLLRYESHRKYFPKDAIRMRNVGLEPNVEAYRGYRSKTPQQ